VKSQEEIDEAIGASPVKKEELKLAEQLISGLLGEFEPEEELKSDYRTSLRELLEAKVEGREIAEPVPEAPETPVIDLMEALRASVAASKTAKKGSKASSTGKPAAAKKRAAAGRK
jgi:non-homologous end joining protein Ku